MYESVVLFFLGLVSSQEWIFILPSQSDNVFIMRLGASPPIVDWLMNGVPSLRARSQTRLLENRHDQTPIRLKPYYSRIDY